MLNVELEFFSIGQKLMSRVEWKNGKRKKKLNFFSPYKTIFQGLFCNDKDKKHLILFEDHIYDNKFIKSVCPSRRSHEQKKDWR